MSDALVEVLVARVAATAQRFDNVCGKVMPEQSATPVTWTGGHQNAAHEVVTSRLFEVEIHHVDLTVGRAVDDWPEGLAATEFDVAVEAFTARPDFPSMSLRAEDHADSRKLGDTSSAMVVSGSRAEVLILLLSRSDGHMLRVADGRAVPVIPALYSDDSRSRIMSA